MASNFRQFANDIAAKQKGAGGGVPTYDNFRKGFKASQPRHQGKTETKQDIESNLKESAMWEKRFSDLREKVKEQRL